MDICTRCREGEHVGQHRRCTHCGSTDRYPVRNLGRQRPIGGKRGRNSGVTNKAKKRKGAGN